MAKVKTIETTIRRDVTHVVTKCVPEYETECLKVIYGDGVTLGEAGEPLEVESADAEFARLNNVYRSMTDEDGQVQNVVKAAFGTRAGFDKAFADAAIKTGQKKAG